MDELVFLKNTDLFHGIGDGLDEAFLQALSAERRDYREGETVHRVGDYLSRIGLVLSGELQMTSVDFWGNRSIVMEFYPGEFYGESHSLTKEPMFFDIIACRPTALITLDPEKILVPGADVSPARLQLQENMIGIIARKKIAYMHEIDYLMKRTTREKLITFLSEQARRSGSSAFYIPYNRQQLAEHLAVDRCALSRELSHMKDDGLLEYKRNFFDLRYVRA